MRWLGRKRTRCGPFNIQCASLVAHYRQLEFSHHPTKIYVNSAGH